MKSLEHTFLLSNDTINCLSIKELNYLLVLFRVVNKLSEFCNGSLQRKIGIGLLDLFVS